MHYEINVSKNGVHYFATHKRSLDYKEKAMEMARHFEKVFPEKEGYCIDMTFVSTTGETINPKAWRTKDGK